MTSWKELNKKQKKVYGSKEAYQEAKRRGGYKPKDKGEKGPELIEGINDRNLDKKYNQLTDKQKEKIKDAGGSRKSFYNAKREKKAQDHLTKVLNRNRRFKQAENVDKLRDYDTTAGGFGSDRGKDHLSRSDVKHLKNMGFDKEKIIKYSEKKVAKGTGQGRGARGLLEKWKTKIADKRKTDQSKDKEVKAQPYPYISPGGVEQVIGNDAGTQSQVNAPVGTSITGDNNVADIKADNSSKIFDAKDRADELLGGKLKEITAHQVNSPVGIEITGDNNYAGVDIDNSFRYYGGDKRKFVYKGGKNDLPSMSAATMSGFYEVDDSPAAQAQRTDLATDLLKQGKNNDFMGAAIRTIGASKAQGLDYTDDDYYRDQHRTLKRAGVSRSRGRLGLLDIFGDQYKRPKLDWNSAVAPDPLKDPNFD